MPFGRFVLGACLGLCAVASAQAGAVTSTWNNWTAVANPDFSGGVGVLAPAAGSDLPATLSIDNTGALYGGLYGGFYYTGAAAAEFVLASALQAGDVSTLTLSIISAGNSFISQPSLAIGGQDYAFDAQTAVSAGEVEGFAAQLLTFRWDLGGLGAFAGGSLYQIAWTFDAHSAFTEIGTAQVGATAAVPEPAACAMMLAGLAGVGAMARRRGGRAA